MKKSSAILVAVLAVGALAWANVSNASGMRVGGGLHYLRNISDVNNAGGVNNISLDKNSVSLLGSVQSGGGLLRLEGQLEYVFNYLGSDNAMWQPSAWILTPGMIYGGGGIGVGYIDGDWQKSPFYALRAGVDIPLSSLHLDAYASYRFQSSDALKDFSVDDLNSLTIAAVLRFRIGGE